MNVDMRKIATGKRVGRVESRKGGKGRGWGQDRDRDRDRDREQGQEHERERKRAGSSTLVDARRRSCVSVAARRGLGGVDTNRTRVFPSFPCSVVLIAPYRKVAATTAAVWRHRCTHLALLLVSTATRIVISSCIVALVRESAECTESSRSRESGNVTSSRGTRGDETRPCETLWRRGWRGGEHRGTRTERKCRGGILKQERDRGSGEERARESVDPAVDRQPRRRRSQP